MSGRPRWVGDIIALAGIAILFGIVYLLPPDTSLAQMTQSGMLRICAPPLYPPLVTGQQNTPGFDIEFARAIAERLSVKLVISTSPAMGHDFNPRNWNLTRAQCQMLAGGVVVSDLTRSFLDTTPPHLATGWALAAKAIPSDLHDKKIGFYAGLVGLDRIALSRFLQAQKARVEIMPTIEAMTEALRTGRIDAGVGEALLTRQAAGTIGAKVAWLPEYLGRYPVAFGLWKGDLTLKRRLEAIIDGLEAEGRTREIARHYHIEPIEKVIAMK
jgi:ABC-type amino acid transport substrate-binding protein